jgi:hypothetical protein
MNKQSNKLDLPAHMQQMLDTQAELQQIYLDQEKKKRLEFNKLTQAKKYYGNTPEYWNKWNKQQN